MNENIEEYIQNHGQLIITPVGVSMWPMLRGNRDTVLLVKPNGRLKKYDLPVYKRDNGSFIMHRVLEVHPDSYTVCGDHQVNPEYGIRDEQIIAVVKGFYRDEKYISSEDKHYMRYCRFWCKSLKRRKMLMLLPDFLKRCKSYAVRRAKKLTGGL